MSGLLTRLALTLALAAVPLEALGQEPSEEAAPSETQLGAPNPSQEPEESSKPAGLEDAQANIGSIIEAFIGERSPDGFWPLRDKKTRRLRRLKLLKIDERKVKGAGGARYTAPAALKDLASGETLQAVFTVDFSGPNWKVVGMKMPAPGSGVKPRK